VGACGVGAPLAQLAAERRLRLPERPGVEGVELDACCGELGFRVAAQRRGGRSGSVVRRGGDEAGERDCPLVTVAETGARVQRLAKHRSRSRVVATLASELGEVVRRSSHAGRITEPAPEVARALVQRLCPVERACGARELAEVVAGARRAAVLALTLVQREALAVEGLRLRVARRGQRHRLDVQRVRQRQRLVTAAGGSEGLTSHAPVAGMVALVVGEERRRQERAGTHGRRQLVAARVHRPLEPFAAFADVAALPQAEEVGGELDRTLGVPTHEEVEGGAQVVQLGVEPVERLPRATGAEYLTSPPRQRRERGRDEPVCRLPLAVREALEQVLPDRPEDEEPRLD
jgi:hypothetical protein